LRRGLNTIDHSGFNCDSSSRTASRMRRLIRLRTTALPRARGVVKPTRGPATLPLESHTTASLRAACALASHKTKAAKYGHVWRVPLS
jgi:hypothetical protein